MYAVASSTAPSINQTIYLLLFLGFPSFCLVTFTLFSIEREINNKVQSKETLKCRFVKKTATSIDSLLALVN